MATLAELVRQYRSDAGLSQEALAERAGVSPRTVSDIECGVARSPRAITMSLLAEALGLADGEREQLRATLRRPAAPASQPFHITQTLPRLVGRDREIVSAATLLTDPGVRLLTFLGGAGIGKTSLALAAAAAAAPAFRGGVLLVELAAVPDAAFVPTKIAFAAQIRDARGATTAERIAAELRGRRTLMILDTCEHVAGAAPFIAELLEAVPELTIAATSRVPLRIAAEEEFSVGALSPDDSVALLAMRAAGIGRPLLGDPAAIAGLARVLSGIPLALTLAAPLITAIPADILAGNFEQRLALLATTGDDVPPRQRTMRDAIGWSYNLLSDEERRLFRALAPFRASFTADAAHAAAGSDEAQFMQTLRILAILVDQHLLSVVENDDAEPRFVVMDLVREYAAEELARSSEAEAVYARLADYALAVAEPFTSGLAAELLKPAIDRLTRETGTFDAVLGWARATGRAQLGLQLAVELWDFWWFCGAYAQGLAWLSALLAAAEAGAVVSDDLLARAYSAAAGLAEARGTFEDGESFAAKALPLKEAVGDRRGVAALLSGRGVAASERGDYALAEERFLEGLRIRREIGDVFAVGKSLFDLGQNAENSGDSAAAERYLHESLRCFQEADSGLGTAFVFAFLGLIAARTGRADRAETFGREALRLGRVVAHQAVIAQAMVSLAYAALARGEITCAIAGFREALALQQTIGDGAGIPETTEGLAAALLAAGDPHEASRLLDAAAAWRSEQRLHVYPGIRALHDRLVADVQAALAGAGSAYATQ